MKKIIFSITFIITLISFSNDYGVFIGLDNGKIDKFSKYETIVIDANYFSKKDIDKIHKKTKFVYSYLNIGSIEEFRDYYTDYKDIILKKYVNWNDEYWVDITNKRWKNFIINKYAKSLYKKGIDGFFIDNIDNYHIFKNDKVYFSILEILKGLRKYNIKIMVNGGDTFIKEAIQKNDIKGLVDSINQENVFTKIDFKNKKYLIQDKNETKYYKDYLNLVKNYGISIYLLEYGENNIIKEKIKSYCKKNKCKFYMSKNLELK
ncbi:endo alpha-1,4 polygalactosaminidase [Oceanivirga salmonicida]|uniref:endo alpha-1,4 polygalactosaminidase n=1 Tax=Oceanivirga salmonicida TaxID=1769291 RepID=UPI00082A909A|nr:endo alpha-1,4 polygalactosaminidase [Oceanivirga salmonicida]